MKHVDLGNLKVFQFLKCSSVINFWLVKPIFDLRLIDSVVEFDLPNSDTPVIYRLRLLRCSWGVLVPTLFC